MDINDFWYRRKVLITGATGFLGSRLSINLLLRRADVSVVAHSVDYNNPIFGPLRSGIFQKAHAGEHLERIYWADMRDFDSLKTAVIRAEPEFIFHLAATSQVQEASLDPLHSFDVNAVGTVRLLEACRQVNQDAKIILSTTDKVYGGGKGRPFVEDDPLDAEHPYDAGKACADLMARSFAHSYGLRIAVVRFANLYGAGDTNWRRLIPGMIRWMLGGETPIFRSDGSFVRQYLYVKDAITALHRVSETLDARWLTSGEVLNIAPRESYSAMRVYELIREEMPEGLDLKEPEIRGVADDEERWLKVSPLKAEKKLNWKAETSIEEGLARTIPWYQDYFTSKDLPSTLGIDRWEESDV